jgi:Flp pilus assembly protein TadB
MTRPNLLQYIGYSFGRKLPDSMRDWVRNDLTGDAALARHLFRAMVPFLPVFAAVVLLLPGPFVLRGASLLLALILALIYAFAFRDMNRRRRLAQHGLPVDLEDAPTARRRERSREQYRRLYGHE